MRGQVDQQCGDQALLPAGTHTEQGAMGDARQFGANQHTALDDCGFEAAAFGARAARALLRVHLGAAARAALHDFGHELAAQGLFGAVHQRDQAPQPLASEGLGRLPHRGQRRHGDAGDLQVVEARDRDVAGHGDTALREHVERAQGHVVVGAGDGADRFDAHGALVEQLADRERAGLTQPAALQDEARIERDAALVERRAVGGVTLLGFFTRGRAADERDAAVAVHLDQVQHDIPHAGRACDRNAVHARHLDAQVHDRAAAKAL